MLVFCTTLQFVHQCLCIYNGLVCGRFCKPFIIAHIHSIALMVNCNRNHICSLKMMLLLFPLCVSILSGCQIIDKVINWNRGGWENCRQLIFNSLIQKD